LDGAGGKAACKGAQRLAERCGVGGPQGQTEPPKAAKGRADLRAPQRSDLPKGQDSPITKKY